MTDRSASRVVLCPRCAAAVAWTPTNRFRPFCSERCKTIDLGAWANEEYRFASKDDDGGLPTEDDQRG